MIDPQELFEYALENGVELDMVNIFEALDKFPDDVMDAFDYCLGMPEEQLRMEREMRNA